MPSFPMIPRFSLAGQDQCSVANIPMLGQSWPMLGRQHPNARTILANARSPNRKPPTLPIPVSPYKTSTCSHSPNPPPPISPQPLTPKHLTPNLLFPFSPISTHPPPHTPRQRPRNPLPLNTLRFLLDKPIFPWYDHHMIIA